MVIDVIGGYRCELEGSDTTFFLDPEVGGRRLTVFDDGVVTWEDMPEFLTFPLDPTEEGTVECWGWGVCRLPYATPRTWDS